MDDNEFAAFVDEHKDSLINYLTHLTRSRERAEEFAQDAFVRFYRAVSKLDARMAAAPYLFRIATNLAITHIRRERRWNQLLPRLIALTPRTAPPADEATMTGEIERKVAAALATLPIKFRSPLVLFEIESWSYDDIARALGCRIGTVKSRISRARALMRAQLESCWIGESHERCRIESGPAHAGACDCAASLHV